jgi:hypothetical protein
MSCWINGFFISYNISDFFIDEYKKAIVRDLKLINILSALKYKPINVIVKEKSITIIVWEIRKLKQKQNDYLTLSTLIATIKLKLLNIKSIFFNKFQFRN